MTWLPTIANSWYLCHFVLASLKSSYVFVSLLSVCCVCVCVCVCAHVRAQLCHTLCNPMDCSLPGSSVHVSFQARTLERVAISYSRRSSQPRNQTRTSCVSCTGRKILYHCATWEALSVSYTLEIYPTDV